ncbi:hypothetical protein GCM10027288_13810 [Bordetella tumbae]
MFERSEFAQPPRLMRLAKGSLAAQAARPDDRAGTACTRQPLVLKNHMLACKTHNTHDEHALYSRERA